MVSPEGFLKMDVRASMILGSVIGSPWLLRSVSWISISDPTGHLLDGDTVKVDLSAAPGKAGGGLSSGSGFLRPVRNKITEITL